MYGVCQKRQQSLIHGRCIICITQTMKWIKKEKDREKRWAENDKEKRQKWMLGDRNITLVEQARETWRKGFLSTGVTGDWEHREQRYTSLWPQPIKIAFVNLKSPLWHPLWGFYDLPLRRGSLLIPPVHVTSVCLPAHKDGKQNPAEDVASLWDVALGFEWRLHSWTRLLIQTKGIIARLLFAACVHFQHVGRGVIWAKKRCKNYSPRCYGCVYSFYTAWESKLQNRVSV